MKQPNQSRRNSSQNRNEVKEVGLANGEAHEVDKFVAAVVEAVVVEQSAQNAAHERTKLFRERHRSGQSDEMRKLET